MRYFFIPFLLLILASCSDHTRFQIVSSDVTGIDFMNTITETDSFQVMSYEYIYNGAGVGVGDLNNDGLQDLIFAGNQVQSKVYLNTGSFRFRDITSNFEGLSNNQWYSSVTVVDINGDGWLDVYLTSTASNNPRKCRNRLWINQGSRDGNDPVFREMSESYGIADDHQSVNAAFLDYDLDGDLDLYIMNNTLTQRMNTSYRAKITDGTATNNDQLYRNNGNGTFTNVTIEAGIVIEGFGLGLAIGDVNKDGYPDIYVSNDYISNDLLYINQKNGTFKNEIGRYMSYQAKSSMGNDMADVNNDGYPDMYTMDMMPESYARKRQTINGFSYIFYVNDEKYGYEHQYLRNMLNIHNGFINDQMLPYSEVGQFAGLYQSEWSWSALFADYDNDGDKDLLIANGYPKDLTDKDWTFYKVKVFGFIADEKHVIDLAPTVKVQNYAFENTGDLRFIKRSKEWLPDIPTYSYGAAFADLDNDGDLDYVVNNINDEALVLKNTTIERAKGKTGFIRIRLIGSEPNTMALGAKIEIWSNGTYQFNEHFLTRGYASCVDPIVHFGLGRGSLIDSIRITWPAPGKISVIRGINSNQTIEIRESEAVSAADQPKTNHAVEYMFEKDDSVIDYVHRQTDFIDFFYQQPVIPHKFSQIGPVITAGDLNGDKHMDLLIGSTNQMPTTLMLADGVGFKNTQLDNITTKKPFIEGALSIIDIDGDGDNDIVALAGGYENPDEKEYIHYLYRNENGKFRQERLPVPPFPSTVLRPGDFDRDGDIDLFIGSRIKKGMFPFANHSWLLVNDNGTLKSDSANRFDLGMVTDAVWSDYNNDGWTDVLVTREWNSVAVLKNMKGRELVRQDIKEVESFKGIWFSVASADLDNDGDEDYIFGNLGENHRFTVNERYPMNIYALDLDLNGTLDPVTTACWKDKNGRMQEYPVNYFDELRGQSDYFSKLFESYVQFSYATIHDMISEDLMKRLDIRLTVNSTSSCILWNDNGTFRWERLPQEVQYSPVKKTIIRDLNGDSLPDVIVTGNDHTYDVATGNYDSNKGIVMINQGPGKPFEILPPSKSGLLLNGMVESLLWLDGEEPLVVAGINRGKVAVHRFIKK